MQPIINEATLSSLPRLTPRLRPSEWTPIEATSVETRTWNLKVSDLIEDVVLQQKTCL